ncbi:CPCC family cysteine-rich protein [Saccharicrinis carchari]|nr:CPCC family cysteine-rich protein [Saccharicrinis carchari]
MKKIDLNEYCPCCGYNSFDPKKRLELEICPICFWEDDPLQFNDPHLEFSGNLVSLSQAQQNYTHSGASHEDMKRYCQKPGENAKRNPEWS